jgi:hypothetical protein
MLRGEIVFAKKYLKALSFDCWSGCVCHHQQMNDFVHCGNYGSAKKLRAAPCCLSFEVFVCAFIEALLSFLAQAAPSGGKETERPLVWFCQ